MVSARMMRTLIGQLVMLRYCAWNKRKGRWNFCENIANGKWTKKMIPNCMIASASKKGVLRLCEDGSSVITIIAFIGQQTASTMVKAGPMVLLMFCMYLNVR